jgi:hypothetical protein
VVINTNNVLLSRRSTSYYFKKYISNNQSGKQYSWTTFITLFYENTCGKSIFSLKKIEDIVSEIEKFKKINAIPASG